MAPFRGTLNSVLSAHRKLVEFGLYGGVTALGCMLVYPVRFKLSWNASGTCTFLATLAILVEVRLLCDAALSVAAQGRYAGVSAIPRPAGAPVDGHALGTGMRVDRRPVNSVSGV